MFCCLGIICSVAKGLKGVDSRYLSCDVRLDLGYVVYLIGNACNGYVELAVLDYPSEERESDFCKRTYASAVEVAKRLLLIGIGAVT